MTGTRVTGTHIAGNSAAGRPWLAIMAKAPRAGDVKTRLCPPLDPIEAAELARAFLADTIALVDSLPARRAMAYAPPDAHAMFAALAPGFTLVPQRGDDLGARLLHTFEDLLADGAPAAVVIGSDIPTVPRAHLEAALGCVADADVVLGPSDDGGYYLVGLSEPRPELFRDIAWSTSTVLDDTIDRARRLGLEVAILPSWFDVDTGADLERLDASLVAAPGAAHTRAFFAARRAGATRS